MMEIDSCEFPALPKEELIALYECPVCFEYITPPIYQCENGHVVCQQCRQMLTQCPTCRVEIRSNIRNLQMERIGSTIPFPCKNSAFGCTNEILCRDRAQHEVNCEFRPYACPCPGNSCQWQGSINQVMAHLMQNHQTITTLEGEDIVFLATDINLNGDVDWVMIQSCYSHHFMLVLEKQQNHGRPQFYAVIQIFGTQSQAEMFMYRLELTAPNRRSTWEATPRSMSSGIRAAINEKDCFQFDALLAQKFSENGNLAINVTISRV